MPNTLLAQDNKILKECFYKLLSNDCLVQKAIAPKCLIRFLKVLFFKTLGPFNHIFSSFHSNSPTLNLVM